MADRNCHNLADVITPVMPDETNEMTSSSVWWEFKEPKGPNDVLSP